MKDCGIVKDLLPLVAENMASEESAAFVKEHLELCADCRAAFDAMKTPVEAEPAAPLKTVKKAVKKRGWLIAGTIACLVAAIAASFLARILKPIVIHEKEEAFFSVGHEGPIRVEIRGDDIYLMNVEFDPETGEAVLITDGEHFSLKELQTQQTDGGDISFEDYHASRTREDAEDDPEGRLILQTYPGVEVEFVKNGREISVLAYTTLYGQWFRSGSEPTQTAIPLKGFDAIFFEPFNNTEHEVLYLRDGYTPEAGFALPRLVMNYYFLIALAGTGVLAVVWLILLLTKKQKARRVFGVLLLIAASGVLAFLLAGFPATTIAPLRELIFVCIIALLLIGAGLCGRKLLKKE